VPAKALLCSGALLVGAICPQVSQADAGTGHVFLGWDTPSQDGFISTSISMAGIIASQTKPSIAACIDEWYFQNPAIKAQRNDEIRQSIRENRDFHPGAVIYALLTKRCGAFS